MTERKSLDDVETFKPAWVSTIEDPTEESVNALSKGELVWVAAWFAGADEPDEPPHAHNGTVSKELLRKAVYALANPDDAEAGYPSEASEADEADAEENQENEEAQATEENGEVDPANFTRDELNELAMQKGFEDPDNYDTKSDLADAINAL